MTTSRLKHPFSRLHPDRERAQDRVDAILDSDGVKSQSMRTHSTGRHAKGLDFRV